MIACLVLGLGGFFSALLISSSVLLFIFFLFYQKRMVKPLVPLSLFKSKSYTTVIIAFFLKQYVFSASIVLVALYLQGVLGIPILKASFIFLALNVVFGIIAPFGGHLVDKIGIKWPTTIGLLCLGSGLVFFSTLTVGSPNFYLYLFLFVVGLGMGLAFSALNAGMIKTVNEDQVGLASSVFLLCSVLGNALGVLITTTVYELKAKYLLLNFLSQKIPLTQSEVTEVGSYIHRFHSATATLPDFLVPFENIIRSHIPDFFCSGMSSAILIAATASFVAGGLCFFAIKK